MTPELTLVQFSDTHLVREGELTHGAVDTLANLEAAADAVATSGAVVSGLLLTGDLADDGAPGAYRRLRAVIEPLAARLGAKVLYAMGNHDSRPVFEAELGVSPYSVHRFGGVRVVVLDSSVPGRHDGRLDPEQLAWLRAELATPAPGGTVLALHHPPLPSPHPTVHLLRLKNSDALGAVIEGTDVRLITTGHAHHAAAGSLAGVPVWVSPALAYRVEALSPRGRLRGLADTGFSRIDLVDGRFVVTAVPLLSSPVVYDRDAAEMTRFIADLTPEA
ncbi:metallophosphoesterase [Actinosynnema sp. NPDC047251]|uniref:Metallophosphoesterase n=1 Tax=Saccharothrix espanaensis (strain ATCC 51144 / DSM 44229 / JCM 9112 / NBRC 15066 / NRRL 15764) TaxID=1179773 RepID=K0K2F6_SACES|nr:metallophosphoesterase [Saccharothrix espanaensis]CCH31039.1 Metallophosphoesterase [Saccharothrix espanaensis DSM 44229]